MVEIEVSLKPQFLDAQAQGARHDLNLLGTVEIAEAQSAAVYKISGEVDAAFAKRAAAALLADPVTENWRAGTAAKPPRGVKRVEIWFKDSVTDVTGESVADAIHSITGTECRVRCAQTYLLRTNAAAAKLEQAVFKTLANALIHKVVITG
ncbi:MAG: phosphoribosylformylglycinamidine synthase subunit PurS [Elusimicrobiales bacterium]|nr:phosphoribosylformylglycinamidine synthase subunit PurS [Elusimicrobiales bacterium]